MIVVGLKWGGGADELMGVSKVSAKMHLVGRDKLLVRMEISKIFIRAGILRVPPPHLPLEVGFLGGGKGFIVLESSGGGRENTLENTLKKQYVQYYEHAGTLHICCFRVSASRAFYYVTDFGAPSQRAIKICGEDEGDI